MVLYLSPSPVPALPELIHEVFGTKAKNTENLQYCTALVKTLNTVETEVKPNLQTKFELQ